MKSLDLNTQSYKVLLKQFGEWLTIENYQPNTVKEYVRSLHEFFSYLEKENILNIRKVKQIHFTQFKNYLQTRINFTYQIGGIRNITVNASIKAINCFASHFNVVNEAYKLDLYESYLPIDVSEKIILTQDEVMELYNATFEQYKTGSIELGQRDRVMIAVYYGCGLRLNEGRMLNVSDIDFVNNRILVRNGKGKKQRYVPIPRKHLEDIRDYIQNGRDWFKESHNTAFAVKYSIKKLITKDDEDALFLNVMGKRMMCFKQRINFLKERTSITKTITTHTFRHSVATHLLQRGWKLEDISKYLGHASTDSTQIYVHILKELEYEKEIQNNR